MDRDLRLDDRPGSRGRPARRDPDLSPSRRAGPRRRSATPCARAGARSPSRASRASARRPSGGASRPRRARASRWVVVEATPGTGRPSFYRLIARRSGSDARPVRPARAARLPRRALARRATAGRSPIDEAQNLDADDPRRGSRPVRTASASPTASRRSCSSARPRWPARSGVAPGAGLASRLAAHVHLRPLDADEVGLLLRAVDPGRRLADGVVDRVASAPRADVARPGWSPSVAARTASRTPSPRRRRRAGRGRRARDEPLVGPARAADPGRGRPDRGRLVARGRSRSPTGSTPTPTRATSTAGSRRRPARSGSTTTTPRSRPGTSGRRIRDVTPRSAARAVADDRPAVGRGFAAGDAPERLGRRGARLRPVRPALLQPGRRTRPKSRGRVEREPTMRSDDDQRPGHDRPT